VKKEGSDILNLNEDNIDEVINNNEFAFIEFFTPWCPHCSSIAATYEDLATTLKEKGSKVVCGKVNGVTSAKLVERFGIDAYPRFVLFRDGVPTTYQGSGSLPHFEEYLEGKQAPSTVLINNAEELKAFLAGEGTKAIAAIGDVTSKNFNNWKKISLGEGYEWLTFAHVTDASLLGLETTPGVKIFPPVGEPLEYTDLFVRSKISTFLKEKSYPLLQPITENTWHEISGKSKPHVCLMFWEGKEDFDMGLKLAEEFKKDGIVFTFKSVNSTTTFWADQWGASGKVFPTAIFIRWPQPNEPEFTVYDENNGTLTLESATNFLNLALENKYVSFRKSEEAPEQNDYPVTIIVGRNFEDIVYDDQKDVVVDFYATWCEYSSALEPVWELVGEVFEKEENVIIGKLDIPNNKPPANIDKRVQELPTILLFRAGHKDEPIEFPDNTDRTVENLTKWILENIDRKTNVDLANLPEEPELPASEGEEEAEDEVDEKFEL